MRWCAISLLPVLACLVAQTSAKVPPKEDLCGLIVDAIEEQKCLRCFAEAGDMRKHPDKVRKCVGKHLPPDVAECSVPHPNHRMAEGSLRMQHGADNLHHNNHTNANLLPNCLRRRMRDMARYLNREKRFTEETGRMVRSVAASRVLKGGGPAMVGVAAQQAILDLPEVKEIVDTHASSCLVDYNLENYEEEDLERIEPMRKAASSMGNNLPFGGTNTLARHIMLGQCIIKTLVDNDAGLDLLEVLKRDKFFFPIPHWWVEPLLRLHSAQP